MANPNHLSRGILRQNCEIRSTDSDFDEEDDNVPLARLEASYSSFNSYPTQPSTSTSCQQDVSKSQKKKNFHWSNTVPAYNLNINCIPKQPSQECNT